MLKYIIGAAIIGGLGYVGYKAYQNYKSGSGLPGTSTPLTPEAAIRAETAAGLSQKFLPGAYGTMEGGCMGCMGAAGVQIL